ncbi:MAG: hypothetical protein HQM10_01430 [Candidatus Riflebacteria bacterium]|nr:hypothetical protein [Candidatus Riflebacteria bacterium]
MRKKFKINITGSAVLVALCLGFILLTVISAVFTISSYRIQNTITESQNLKALGIAEAGIDCAMTELAQNYAFRTHTLDSSLKWLAAEKNQQTLEAKSDFGFSIMQATEGTYKGTLGKGEFKVRCGMIPYKDDPRTLNVDERYCYFRIQSLGKIEKTIRSVDAVVLRKFPGREFLMYDGGFLSIVFGEPGKSNVNKFAVGRLYGHKGIEIGRILMSGHSGVTPGSTQEVNNIDLVSSGDGGIYVYSDTKFSFRDAPTTILSFTKNFDFPTSGKYSSAEAEKYGEYPAEITSGTHPVIPETMKKYIKGKKEGAISIPPKPVPFETYRKQAKDSGSYIPNGDIDYKVPKGWGVSSVKAKIIDFGNNINKVSGPLNPSNGVIFSEESLVIKGNPPKDMKIISMKNIFIAGDFNQAGDPSQKPEKYCFPQNYANNALTDDNYNDTTKAKLLDDAKPGGYKNHKAVSVISRERLVFDYRSPIDCFENEIYPFMKYSLGAVLASESEARANLLKVSGSGGIACKIADQAEVKNRVVASFFAKFPLDDANEEKSVAQKVADKVSQTGGNLQDADFEAISQEVWKAFRNKYDSAKLNDNFGVYKLLNGLRTELGYTSGNTSSLKKDEEDDYLFFPEMTTNAMFISCAERNSTFYAGPDYRKQFDEIGKSSGCKTDGIGTEHSQIDGMIHRMFGSEVRFSNVPVAKITDSTYAPPTRRKIYDESLPSLGFDSADLLANSDISSFIILTWKDSLYSGDYNSF